MGDKAERTNNIYSQLKFEKNIRRSCCYSFVCWYRSCCCCLYVISCWLGVSSQMFDPVQYPYLLFKVVYGLLALQGWWQTAQIATHQTLLLWLVALEVLHSFHARDTPVSQFISLYPSGLNRFAIEKDNNQVIIILRYGSCKAGSSCRRYTRFNTVNSFGPQKLLCILPTVAPLISCSVSIL